MSRSVFVSCCVVFIMLCMTTASSSAAGKDVQPIDSPNDLQLSGTQKGTPSLGDTSGSSSNDLSLLNQYTYCVVKGIAITGNDNSPNPFTFTSLRFTYNCTADSKTNFTVLGATFGSKGSTVYSEYDLPYVNTYSGNCISSVNFTGSGTGPLQSLQFQPMTSSKSSTYGIAKAGDKGTRNQYIGDDGNWCMSYPEVYLSNQVIVGLNFYYTDYLLWINY